MSHSFDTANGYPLSWPTGTPRTPGVARRFWRSDRPAFGRALGLLIEELERLGVHQRDLIVSTDRRLRLDGMPYASDRAPADPGVAVWFKLDGEPRVMACDAFRSNEGNMRGITKTIEALRGIERWGVGDQRQAFAGYAALPPSASDAVGDPWQVLGIEKAAASIELIRSRYRELAKQRHPDQATGSAEAMTELTRARDAALSAMDKQSVASSDGGAS